MTKKIKISKLLIVLFLTILIWVWADLATDEEKPVYNAKIVTSRSGRNFWVSFPQGTSIDVNQIDFKGPASKISDLNKIINNEPEKLEFPLVIEQFEIEETGQHTLDVQEIIKKSDWVKKSGLSIISCDPSKVVINVDNLVTNDIDVQCFGQDGFQKNLEEPLKISMRVPSTWSGKARVVLTPNEILKATEQAIPKKPFITLTTGQRIDAENTVNIKLPKQEDPREEFTITTASIGFNVGENLIGKPYEINILNRAYITNIQIYATKAAKEAYEKQTYQIRLEIYEKDIDDTIKNKFATREVKYELPEEFVRKDEIEIRKKESAEFTVTPITSDTENQ